MTALAILEKVDGEILTDESKWCKMKGFSGDACCLVNAIDKAAFADVGGRTRAQHATFHNDAHRAAEDAVRALTPHRAIVAFNDAPTTTFADVKRVLAAAIADLRNRR